MNEITDVKQKTISGLFWRFGERITSQIVTFIVTVVLARILMPADYGVIAIVNIFIAIADVLITSGLGTSLIQRKDVNQKDFSTIFWAGLLLSSILYLILFFASPMIAQVYHEELLVPVIRVMGLRFFISSISSVQQAFVSKKMIYKKFFLATFVGTCVSAIAGIYMALNGFGVWALVAQQLINPFIDTIVLFVTVRWFPSIEFSITRFKDLFSFAWKIMATSLIGTLFDKLRSFLIGTKYTSADLAYYNRGESLPILVTNNIVLTLESVLFPAMSSFQDDPEKLKVAVRRSMSVGSYVLMPLLLGLAAVADKVVIALFTDKWSFAIPFVVIVCIQEIPVILSSANIQAIKANGRSDVVLKLEFVKKPVYLLILLITMRISPLAMAIGNAVYGFVALLVNGIPNSKLLNYNLWDQLKDISLNLFMSTLMAICVFLLGKVNLNIYIVLTIQILGGIFIYIIESLVFRSSDFRYILNIFFKRGINVN